MITTKDTIQGDYAEQYSVGIAVNNCTNLAEELLSFYEDKGHSYMKGRNQVIKIIQNDCGIFDRCIKSFLSKK